MLGLVASEILLAGEAAADGLRAAGVAAEEGLGVALVVLAEVAAASEDGLGRAAGIRAAPSAGRVEEAEGAQVRVAGRRGARRLRVRARSLGARHVGHVLRRADRGVGGCARVPGLEGDAEAGGQVLDSAGGLHVSHGGREVHLLRMVGQFLAGPETSVAGLVGGGEVEGVRPLVEVHAHVSWP